MSKKFQLNLCKKEFWNDFFSPRYPGLFIILLLALLDTIYTCAVVLMSAYYDNFSHVQHAGYLTIFIANLIVIITGFLSIHFLTLKPANMQLSYCIFLHMALICAILLVIVTTVLMFIPPAPSDIREHTYRNVDIYHRAPYMMRLVMKEKQCCGILKYGDIFKIINYDLEVEPDNSMRQIHYTYYRIPPSCCQTKVNKKCRKWTQEKLLTSDDYEQHHLEYLNQNPCFKKGEDFSAITATSAYSFYTKTVYASSLGVLVFIFGILVVLNYYIWYKFPRMPEEVRPDRFIQDLRTLVNCHFNKLRKDMLETKRKKMKEKNALKDGNVDSKSNFEVRHQKIMQSLANIRAQNRELRQKELHVQLLNVVKSGTSIHSNRSALRVHSETKVHPSATRLSP